MTLALTNIGKIKNATVEINGITVIAGENDTGKSTVGKALFSVFNGFYDVKEQIRSVQVYSFKKKLDRIMADENPEERSLVYSSGVANLVSEKIDEVENLSDVDLPSLISDAFSQNAKMYGFELKQLSENSLNQLSDIFRVNDDTIFQELLKNRFYSEFNGQISNIHSDKPGEIKLIIKDDSARIKVSDNEIIQLDDLLNLRTEAIYIDNPFVVDESLQGLRVNAWDGGYYYDHKSHLKSKLAKQKQDSNVINKILISNRFDDIFNKIGFSFEENPFERLRPMVQIKAASKTKSLSIKNLSTGIKTFLIIKTLLENETIEHGGTIILDEPEIHLHPEWQLLFAELIVLLQKEFGMHILLNTHSPYFLRAIQVYSAKHEIADKCKYYLADLIEDAAHIVDVSNDIDKIYEKLFLPFQKLEDDRWNND